MAFDTVKAKTNDRQSAAADAKEKALTHSTKRPISQGTVALCSKPGH